MSNNKKYLGATTLFKTKCINTDNAQFLYPKWYNVIDYTTTKYLIQFNSGGTMWYSRNRFVGKY
jgi:hypothetical protein